ELVEKIKEPINNEGKVLKDVQASFSSVTECVDVTSEAIEAIHNRAVNLDRAKNAVLDEITTLSSISEENAASTEETTASMAELNETINQLAHSANDLKDLALTLDEETKFFKI
ncbi:MAG: methyl-accepting chemotaxis protein, partial [Pseudobutyrivibrio sp.]|nr:methyl-accepting chemotaxis protein [Pseudobutyrivibrio sp.]